MKITRLILAIGFASGMALAGCDDSGSSEPVEAAEDAMDEAEDAADEVADAADEAGDAASDFAAEAKKEITEANAEDVAEKLATELDAELAELE